MRLLDRINRTGTTVVMATHDQGIVDTMRRRVIELDRGTRRPRPGPRRLRRTWTVADGAHGRLRRHARRRTNLRRNLLMTSAAVLTVAVSLALVGGALLLKQGVDQGHGAVAGRRRAVDLHEARRRRAPESRRSSAS